MNKTPYAERSQRSQIGLLRQHAIAFLQGFSWPGSAQVECINHGYNTTFRVRAEGFPEAALRINTNSSKTWEHIQAETAFVRHLSESGVLVPNPLSSPGGEFVLCRDWEGPRPLKAVLYTWLPGRLYRTGFTAKNGLQLGALTKQLHQAAEGWKPPDGAQLVKGGDPLGGLPWVMDEQQGHGIDLGVWREVWKRAEALYVRIDETPRIVIHDDLHMWNLMKTKAGMAVFDFDDMVLGWPIRDAAVTLFYIRRLNDAAKVEEAYWKGLGLTPEEAGLTQSEFELMVGARVLLLANDLAQSTNSELRAEFPGYVGKADRRLRRLLDDGVYLPLDSD